MPIPSISDLIASLQLQPHPEGGWFRETHRSLEAGAGGRCASTSILFLLEHPHVSHLHRIDAEELWYWHAGSCLDVSVIHPDGRLEVHHLGAEGVFQAVVPKGCWFGAELAQAGTWALVGCAVAPGFEFAGFEMAARDAILAEFPQHAERIERLT